MHARSAGIPISHARRISRFVGIALCLVAGVWFARFAYLRITLEPTPRPDYWEEKIAALDPDPPDAVAFKTVLAELLDRPFEAAFNSATSNLRGMYACDQTALLSGDWDESRGDIAAATPVFESADFADRRRVILELSLRPWALPAVASPQLNLAHLSPFRQWAKWLVAHSRWSVEHEGNSAAAIEDWLAVLRMSRQVARHGLLIDHLTGVATVALASQEMTLIANRIGRLPDCRDFAESIDHACGPELTADQLMAAERLYHLSMLEFLYVRDGGDWLAVNAAASPQLGIRGPVPTPSAVWNLSSPLFHNLETARRRVDRVFDDLGGCNDLVSAWKKCQDGRVTPRLSPLDGIQQWNKPAMLRASVLYYRGRQSLEAAIAINAIEQFRLGHGRYPGRLEELLPDFLHRLPIDYADRQPLRYRRKGERYVLYSIAENGVDDGGAIERSGTHGERQPRWERDADFIFTDSTRREFGN